MRTLLLACCLLMALPAAAQPDAMHAHLEAVLQPLLDEHPEAAVAVAVRDPATGTRYSRLGDRPFHAASTMKVPVMIEAFRQAEEGRIGLDDSLEVRNAFRSIVDGSTFAIEDDSDDAIYERLGQHMSVRELVYQMITVSSNLATNLLIDHLVADTIQKTIERMGVEHMRVLRGVEDIKAYRQGLSNTATADDLALLMESLMTGEAISEAASREMVDVLIDQQFNTMIPTGLPEDARVAHKTGWITRIHHDAAIVYPKDDAPYVLVVLTEGIDDEDASARLGARIAGAVHEVLRGAR